MDMEKLTGNGTFKFIRELGFPIVVAMGLFWLVVWQQKQYIQLNEHSIQALENNTRALARIELIVNNVTIRGNRQDGK